jgi:NAD(P)-dependent dehydrogenase (short-subunit alcohol dehydrogenase family)
MKTIIITGAAGNLGLACVETFVKAKYQVVAFVTPGKKIESFLDNPYVDQREVDLLNEQSVEEAIHDIIIRYEKIDAALMLVGGYGEGSIEHSTSEQIKKMFALNFDTAYNIAKPIFLQMKNQGAGGKLIFVGSRPSLQAEEGKNVLGYALSKSLIFKLSDYLNEEGKSKNIQSTVIVPSTLDTPQNRKANPNADFTAWIKPEEIADIMLFSIEGSGRQLRESVLKVYGNS